MSDYIQRNIFPQVADHLRKKEITLIIGPRRVGKTVLLKQLRDYLIGKLRVKPEAIYSFNLDIVKDRKLFQNQTEFIDFIKSRVNGGQLYFFIDEAQKVPEAGVFFKGVYDSELPVKLTLTGSSNLEIRSKIHESLSGRKRVFQLLPLSFEEIVRLKNPVLASVLEKKIGIVSYDREELEKMFYEYCVWGGYPQVALETNTADKKAMLAEIFSSYVEKDIVGFLKIENETNFIKLVGLLAGQTGNLLNIAELSALVGTDRFTIDRYLSALEKTFIIKRLKPYYTNARQEVVKNPKVYFFDTGLRNIALDLLEEDMSKRRDKGALIENAVLKELMALDTQKLLRVRFWRSKQKAEVDFVLEKAGKILPLEVKSNISGNKLGSSLMGFIKRYQPDKALVVNMDFEGRRDFEKTKVIFGYPYQLPARIEELFS